MTTDALLYYHVNKHGIDRLRVEYRTTLEHEILPFYLQQLNNPIELWNDILSRLPFHTIGINIHWKKNRNNITKLEEYVPTINMNKSILIEGAIGYKNRIVRKVVCDKGLASMLNLGAL